MAAYLIAAFVVLAAIAGSGWKGYQLGGDRVRVEWSEANVAAAEAVASDRKAQETKARKSASVLEAKLATQALTSREIKDALDKAMAAKPIPASCAIDDSVRDLWNRANRGESETAGELPRGGSATPGTAKRPD